MNLTNTTWQLASPPIQQITCNPIIQQQWINNPAYNALYTPALLALVCLAIYHNPIKTPRQEQTKKLALIGLQICTLGTAALIIKILIYNQFKLL